MKFFTRIAVLFYVVVTAFLGCFLVMFALQQFDINGVVNLFSFMYEDPNWRLALSTVGLCLIICNYIFANIISDKRQREKTIAFDNPSGRVSVSLTAMEDLVRRLVSGEPEVKEVKVLILASKKGLDINVRLILRSDGNIPEMTSTLQELIKKKIQSTIGLDEAVTVKIHVVKIIPEASKLKPKQEVQEKDEEKEANIPFQGYRP